MNKIIRFDSILSVPNILLLGISLFPYIGEKSELNPIFVVIEYCKYIAVEFSNFMF